LAIFVVGLSAAQFIFQSLNVIDLYFQSRIESRFTIYATNSAFLAMALFKVHLILSKALLLPGPVWARSHWDVYFCLLCTERGV
jgi:hypothetical protein